MAGPLNDEQKKQLTMVRDSARHLLDLINDVLDISKIEAGEVEVVVELFDMREVVEETVQTVMPMAEEKGLSLTTDVAPGVGSMVSDRLRVRQILINLANNAVKFTDEGEVQITCRLSNGHVVTSVRDTGIGIRAEDVPHLFESFRQLDTGAARRAEGTGLGLSISKKLAEMLGGRIQVESEWGVGSTFTVVLPLRQHGE
jgi:signal transduction histidine kinase